MKILRKYKTPIQKKTAAILGNGPSLRDFDFRKNLVDYDTFGMNLAYRYWHTINWFPKYYSCCDRVVGLAHLHEIYELLENASIYGICKFLLRENLIAALDIQNHPLVYNFDEIVRKNHTFFRGYWANTGSLTTAWAAALGYRKIILFGIDASYKKYVDGAVHESELVLRLQKTPSQNPNYFFDEYQQQGDIYHVPFREHPEFVQEDQLLGWHMIRPQLALSHTAVINVNLSSRVTAFPKAPIGQANNALQKIQRAYLCNKLNLLCFSCKREQGAVLDTLGFAKDFLPRSNGTMIDVGAYHGGSSLPFLDNSWTVYAIEPDPVNRHNLARGVQKYAMCIVEADAVSCVSGRIYPWYRNFKNTQYNSMKGFNTDYELSGKVKTITLRKLVERYKILDINLLNVSTVGFEFMVLRGFPFEKLLPSCVVCEWDNQKSLPLGTDMHDVGSFLLSCGYNVFMSEWHPDLGCDTDKQWKNISVYPSEPSHDNSWGYFIAFKEKISKFQLRKSLLKNVHIGVSKPEYPLPVRPKIKRLPYAIKY